MNEQFSDKDVSFKCPNCGATIKAKQSQRTVTCEYCGGAADNTQYRNIFEEQRNARKSRDDEYDEDYEDEDFDEEYDEDYEDEYDEEDEGGYGIAPFESNFESSFENRPRHKHSMHDRKNMRGNGDRNFGRDIFAYVEKSGLFFSGEVPGVTFGKVSLCHTYEECVSKLREIADKERGKAFFKGIDQNMNEVRRKHPNAKIIRV